MDNDAKAWEALQMTPLQHNAVIEEKLTHLRPVMEEALAEMLRLREALSNGEISWRVLFSRALEKSSD